MMDYIKVVKLFFHIFWNGFGKVAHYRYKTDQFEIDETNLWENLKLYAEGLGQTRSFIQSNWK